MFSISSDALKEIKPNQSENTAISPLGYSIINTYRPVIQKPTTLLQFEERDYYLGLGLFNIEGALLPLFIFLRGLITGDSWDGNCYNNMYAVGTQLYPRNLFKYYDMFSIAGLIKYTLDSLLIRLYQSLTMFTLGIPLNKWINYTSAFFYETIEIKEEDIIYLFFPPWFNRLLGLEIAPGIRAG